MSRRSVDRFLALAIVVLPVGAHAAQPASGDPPKPAEDVAIATGTPSNANGTASAVTVADAMVRTDDRLATYTGGSTFGVSLGTSVAGGNFGTGQRSTLWSTAVGARYAIGSLRLTASLPYLHIRGRGSIFSGIDGTPLIVSGGTPGRKVTNKGVGDLTLGAAYTLPTGEGKPEIEFSGRVKIPTAEESRRISSGKTDYSAGLQVTQPIGRFAPFASVTYRVFGDPAAINLRNGFAASTGTSFSLGERAIGLVSYHYARAATRLVRDSHELFAGASTKLPGSEVRATVFGTGGLSKGAAAASGGVSLALEF
ncbi:hypothetical protein [Sphingomonas profundi]|uniref:hypothetical protein n=1 Tax=Alterirhizorhabdus profundi TaxID=2681549 RepID=UPI0012E9106E|nr:hypothetical protein [Sphingomonas profundi]